MKKQFAVLIAVAFASISIVQAQDASTPDASIPQTPGQVQDPSGAPAPPAPPTTDTTDPGAASHQKPEITVTVSQTFTSQTNSITIFGTVDSPEDKQAVEQGLRQALPGKKINNYLRVKVASQEQGQVTEPSGAERPSDQDKEDSAPEATPQAQPEAGPQAEPEVEVEIDSGVDSQP